MASDAGPPWGWVRGGAAGSAGAAPRPRAWGAGAGELAGRAREAEARARGSERRAADAEVERGALQEQLDAAGEEVWALRRRVRELERELAAQEDYAEGLRRQTAEDHDRELEALRRRFEAEALGYREQIRHWEGAVRRAIATSEGRPAPDTVRDFSGGGVPGAREGAKLAHEAMLGLEAAVERLRGAEGAGVVPALRDLALLAADDRLVPEFARSGGTAALGALTRRQPLDAEASECLLHLLGLLAANRNVAHGLWGHSAPALLTYVRGAGFTPGLREAAARVLVKMARAGAPDGAAAGEVERLVPEEVVRILAGAARDRGAPPGLRVACLDALSALLCFRRRVVIAQAPYVWLLQVVQEGEEGGGGAGGAAVAALEAPDGPRVHAFRLLGELFGADPAGLPRARALGEGAAEILAAYFERGSPERAALPEALLATRRFVEGRNPMAAEARRRLATAGALRTVGRLVDPSVPAPATEAAVELAAELCRDSPGLSERACEEGVAVRAFLCLRAAPAGGSLCAAVSALVEALASHRAAAAALADTPGLALLLEGWAAREGTGAEAAHRALLRLCAHPAPARALQAAGAVPAAVQFLRVNFASEARVNEALRLLVELRDLLPEAARDIRVPSAREALQSAAQCFSRSPCQALALALLHTEPPGPAGAHSSHQLEAAGVPPWPRDAGPAAAAF